MPHGARCKALADWLLTTDPHQRIRMAMAGFASLMMTASAIIVVSLTLAGYGRKDWALWWGLFTGTGLVVVLVLIRSACAIRRSRSSRSATHWSATPPATFFWARRGVSLR